MIEAANDSGAAQVAAPDDWRVIEALRGGDEGAFAGLVDRYHASLSRVARSYIPSRAVADEVAEDTWLGVIGRFDAEADAAEAAVARDRFQPADHPTEPGHWTHPPPDVGASPERPLLAPEARQHLQSAIEALPEHQRLVLILCDVEGCSSEEVCNALGLQKTNTRVLLHRARVKVRSALEPYLEGV